MQGVANHLEGNRFKSKQIRFFHKPDCHACSLDDKFPRKQLMKRNILTFLAVRSNHCEGCWRHICSSNNKNLKPSKHGPICTLVDFANQASCWTHSSTLRHNRCDLLWLFLGSKSTGRENILEYLIENHSQWEPTSQSDSADTTVGESGYSRKSCAVLHTHTEIKWSCRALRNFCSLSQDISGSFASQDRSESS